MIATFILAALTATPATLPAVIAGAEAGDTITLSRANYGLVTIANRFFAEPLVIRAGNARMQLVLRDVSGVTLQGGVIRDKIGLGATGYAITLLRVSRVTINSTAIVNSSRGIVIGRSTDVIISRVTFNRMIVDGINIAGSQRVTIRGVSCTNARSGEAHPDCIQMWSRPGMVTQDVLVTGSSVDTAGMQGITAFNHIRAGVDDGGFDRIRVIGNTVRTNMPQGIALYSCRKCEIRRNVVTTMQGAPSVVSINTAGSPDIVLAENQMVR